MHTFAIVFGNSDVIVSVGAFTVFMSLVLIIKELYQKFA